MIEDNQHVNDLKGNHFEIKSVLKNENKTYEECIELFYELCQKLDINEQLKVLSIKDYEAVKSCFILQVIYI